MRYLGSKRKLTPWLVECFKKHITLSGAPVLDAMAGSGQVSLALDRENAVVTANDRADYAKPLLSAVLSPPNAAVDVALKVAPAYAKSVYTHWFVDRYARESKFFIESNAALIAGLRDYLEDEPIYRDILLGNLLMSSDRVCNSMGLHMAYYKTMSPVSLSPFVFKNYGGVTKNICNVTNEDVCTAVSKPHALAYVDPPYTNSSYNALYHIWRTLILWDDPDTYGVAVKRQDTYVNPSLWNSKSTVHQAFQELKASCSSEYLAVSYSSDGLISLDALKDILKPVAIYEKTHKRYAGATTGKKHGSKPFDPTTVKKLNTEYLLVAKC